MTTRRQFLAGFGAGAAALTLDHSTFGALNANALAPIPVPSDVFEAQDWATATVMWNEPGYADGAGPILLPTGELFSPLTINQGAEGTGDLQHTITLHSSDGGTIWRKTGVMEPPEAPEASWGTPWLHVSGRLYVLYTYNAANLRFIANNDGIGPTHQRVDSVGVVAYRSSVDGGYTWTPRRQLDLPASNIDLRNPWHGLHRLFWMGPGPPVTHDDAGYIGITKIGSVYGARLYDDTEAFIMKLWETAPGVLAAAVSAPMLSGLANTEEPSPIVFDDGVINTTFRTAIGELGEAWSTDGGMTWSVDRAQDRHGAIIPHPRALAYQLVLPDGRLFLWGHNNALGTSAGPRNPAFYRIGERVANRIVWGAPRLLLWDKDPAVRISGPCFVFDGDSMMVSATDKVSARHLRFSMVGL